MTRQMCIDYMERERGHFSQFITEGFVSYCKRKTQDKVYGNNLEIQPFSEMYNRPIHIYSYSTEPINIFHGTYNTDMPPLRLSYHKGNHYNSLVDPRRSSIGVGIGLSSLQGDSGFRGFPTLIFEIIRREREREAVEYARACANINRDQVKDAVKAQQDQQIDNALLADGRFYSDLESTEMEIERSVIEASRIECLAEEKFKQLEPSESSASASEPSSSGKGQNQDNKSTAESNPSQSESMKKILSMGFRYLQALDACGIFGDGIDSMLCHLLDGDGSGACSGNSRQKGKAAEHFSVE